MEVPAVIRSEVDRQAVRRSRFQGQRGVHVNAHLTARDLSALARNCP
jgi:hypothetical protein